MITTWENESFFLFFNKTSIYSAGVLHQGLMVLWNVTLQSVQESQI